jgi:hypothetical protein
VLHHSIKRYCTGYFLLVSRSLLLCPAMIANNRPSILSRPTKPPSRSNEENMQKEYEMEQV